MKISFVKTSLIIFIVLDYNNDKPDAKVTETKIKETTTEEEAPDLQSSQKCSSLQSGVVHRHVCMESNWGPTSKIIPCGRPEKKMQLNKLKSLKVAK